jgi:hypothetical protein
MAHTMTLLIWPQQQGWVPRLRSPPTADLGMHFGCICSPSLLPPKGELNASPWNSPPPRPNSVSRQTRVIGAHHLRAQLQVFLASAQTFQVTRGGLGGHVTVLARAHLAPAGTGELCTLVGACILQTQVCTAPLLLWSGQMKGWTGISASRSWTAAFQQVLQVSRRPERHAARSLHPPKRASFIFRMGGGSEGHFALLQKARGLAAFSSPHKGLVEVSLTVGTCCHTWPKQLSCSSAY